MFSKIMMRLLQFTLVLVSATACGLKIGEKAPQPKPVVIGGKGFSCLSHITENLDEFFGAKLKTGEIRTFVGCMRYSLESFAKHARGQDKDIYKPEEIRDFLQEYFLKDKTISDQLMLDFMAIKRALVGGSSEMVSRIDLNQAISFLTFLEEQAVKLNPYMHIYNFSVGRTWVKQNNAQPEVVVAVNVLNEVGVAIGQRLAQANSAYPMARLESFMREFRNFAAWDEVFTNSRSPRSWTAFISAYKSVVAGSQGEQIRPQDWPQLFSAAVGVYGLTLKARYARERQSLLSDEGLDGVVRVADDVVRVLQTSVDQQPNKVVTYAQLDTLVDSLEPLGFMPRVPSADESGGRAIKAESFKKTLRAFLDRILGDPQVSWRKRKSEGLNRLVISQAADEFSRWAEVQRFLDRTFKGRDKNNEGGRVETLSERLGPAGASQNLMRLLGEPGKTKDSVVGLVRLMEQSLRPLFRPGDDQIFLTESSQLAKYQLVHGFHNLSMMNLSRAAIALVARGYSTYRGKGDGPFDGGITDEELQAFYMDFRDLGVDSQLFDPRSDNAGYRSFQEANMFTYTGNGLQRPSQVSDPQDAMLTYPEGIEYLLFIISGGAMGQAIYSTMMTPDQGLCREASKDAPMSVHQYKMVDRQCFKRNLMQILLPRLKTMPTMQAELSHANPTEKLAMAEDLMAAVYSNQWGNPKYIEWHEINTIAVIMHYTESVMTRYNSNEDTVLDTDEVWRAYETFAVYMQQMAQEKCFNLVKAWANPDSPEARINREAESRFGMSAIKLGLKKWIGAKGCDNIPDFVSEAIFAHLVVSGKVPDSLWEINYLPRAPLVGTEFKVNRQALLRVFAALVKASAETAKKNNLL